MKIATRAVSVGVATGLLAVSTYSAAQAAGSAQGSRNVTAAVVNTCSVANASLGFGTINPANGANLSANTNILVQCTLATPFTLALGNG